MTHGTKYKRYVYEAEGEEPTDGAICSAALEMLFAADAGFLQSPEAQRRTGRNGAGERSRAGTAGEVGTSAGGATAGGDKRKKADEQTSAAAG